MPKRNYLLLASVIGLAVFICMFAGLSVGIGTFDPEREAKLDPGAVHRQAVEQSLGKILPANAESAEEAGLKAAAEKLTAEPFIVWVWVMDPNGTLTYVHGGPAQAGDNVRDLSMYEEDLILAMDPALMTSDVELELRLAAALRREGEHNDIYRHLARSIPGPDGKAAAFVGVTFEAVDTTPAAADIAFLVLGAVGFLVYWLGLPVWVMLDSRAGGTWRPALLWGLFVLVANVAGLLAYLLVKHRSG